MTQKGLYHLAFITSAKELEDAPLHPWFCSCLTLNDVIDLSWSQIIFYKWWSFKHFSGISGMKFNSHMNLQLPSISVQMYVITHPAAAAAAAAAKSLQSYPTLCDSIDGSPPGSPVPGILQARTLEWVAISFSNAWKWKVKVKSLSLVRLLVTPRTAAHQASPSMGFSRQENRSGVPLPSPISRAFGVT